MLHKESFQTKTHYMALTLLLPVLLLVSACGGSAEPSHAPTMAEESAAEEIVMVEPAAEQVVEQETATESKAAEQSNSDATGPAPISNRPDVYNRLIIKNAEVEMEVENTDAAINRALGIVTEYRGYVVSNRTWFSNELKYATLTIGVPAENFEEMLRRLKDLAVTVANETVSGQDVTDEFVDLKSRLRNLEATADRIRSFLEQAQDVEESLEVSAQLGQIEAEIEQVKGRMAYLQDRASFSTITLQISPQVILPTPTPTATPTPTPTPVVWSAGRTLNSATTVTRSTATGLFQFTVDLTIWVVVVIVPFLLPVVILIWLGVKLVRRFAGTPQPPSV